MEIDIVYRLRHIPLFEYLFQINKGAGRHIVQLSASTDLYFSILNKNYKDPKVFFRTNYLNTKKIMVEIQESRPPNHLLTCP